VTTGDAVTTGPQLTGSSADMLTVDGISVRLGGRDVLQDVRFAIGAGEFVGLIGSNGAGKTTLLRVILGLQEPSAGTVRIADTGRARHAPAIGYVPQKVLLDPDMPLRARDVVGLGLDGNRLGIPLPSRGRRHLIDEMLRAVGAELFGDERVGNLSGGEQQRVLIAHALISRPSLLLLDEPLANLDIRSEQEIVGLLSRIAREQRISVLLSAHEMNPLLPVIDRVVYLAAGRAASGTTDEVVTTEVLSKLYGQHVDVIHVHGRILVVAGRGDGPALPVGEDGAHCAVQPVPDRL
jgi:zinc/manganese transport system ATP-binding protein